MTAKGHGLPRRVAPRSDETTAYGPHAVFVARNHVHSPAGAPTTHAEWWIGRPGVGPIRRCHRACVPITVLMSTSRCASSARRRAWARERMSGPPTLPHPVEKGVFLRPHRGHGVRARFRSPLLVSGKTLVLNRDLTPWPLPDSDPLPLTTPLPLNILRQQAGSYTERGQKADAWRYASRREERGTWAMRNSIWSARMRRLRRMKSSHRLGTYGV